jgi:hypothetical protein
MGRVLLSHNGSKRVISSRECTRWKMAQKIAKLFTLAGQQNRGRGNRTVPTLSGQQNRGRGNRTVPTLFPGSTDKVDKWRGEHQKPYKSATEFCAPAVVAGSHWCTAGNCKRFYTWLASHKGTTNMQIQASVHARGSFVLSYRATDLAHLCSEIFWTTLERGKKT